MNKLFKIIPFLALLLIIGGCAASLDTFMYSEPINEEVQSASCVVISIEDPTPVATTAKVIKIQEAIMFAFDSDELTTDELNKLDKVAALLKANPDACIVINGWASSEGVEEYNIQLAGYRAIAVKAVLVEKGIVEERIEVVAKGGTDLFGELLNLNRRSVVLEIE